MVAGKDAVNGAGDPDAAPTIYDVARAAGVSIASVSRVLNGQRNPRQETRERVLAAVAELGFAPDGAARALSARLKEVVGVIVRRPWPADMDEDVFADEAESLQYPDLINRGIEAAAQRRGFDLLIRSVGITEHDPGGRTLALARKSDGLILHDRVLEPDQMDRLSRQLPIVTLAGYATPTTANVHGDNKPACARWPATCCATTATRLWATWAATPTARTASSGGRSWPRRPPRPARIWTAGRDGRATTSPRAELR